MSTPKYVRTPTGDELFHAHERDLPNIPARVAEHDAAIRRQAVEEVEKHAHFVPNPPDAGTRGGEKR